MAKLQNKGMLEELRSSLQAETQAKYKKSILLCAVSGCGAYGVAEVNEALREELQKHGLDNEICVRLTGCHGFCEKGPIMTILPEGLVYAKVKVKDVPAIVEKTIINGEVVQSLVYKDPETKERIPTDKDIPFYKHQYRLVFNDNKLIEPTNLDNYIEIGGYSAMAKALLDMTPQDIIEEIKKSGLRGRGGAGFATGKKWDFCSRYEGTRYMLCNADEGDPGAYMDRILLEGNPNSIIEGMVIGARAVGSNDGYVYVRHEYPLAVENLSVAIEKAKEYGLLGKNILGSGFDFDLKISRGGGSFVCGESSALMRSMGGQPGRPRAKYIRSAQKGFRDSPSVLNNVETWANVPIIINKGSEFFASIGTEGSKGTKLFSLVGKVVNTGLIEVPMGTTLRSIIYDIGGGILKGKKFKAIQTGGPSGGCIPEQFLDLGVDFDELDKAGSMMGSGGMIVMDQDTCMVDVARYFMQFLVEESCGQCNPCREGIKQMLSILTEMCEGNGKPGDIELLEEIGVMVANFSLCGLGTSAPNPVLSTIKYFRNEYEAHIHDKKCPGGVCKKLFYYEINPEACNGCHLCFKKCPEQVISGEKKKPHAIDLEKCSNCGICYEGCKFNAIDIK